MISIAIPCYCSAMTLPDVVGSIRAEMLKSGQDYQIILINDGSPDNTFDIIRELCKQDPAVIGINLSRNFGQHSARMAALPYISGDVVVYMDDDGQHPVDKIMLLVAKLDEGYDVAYALFEDKKHSLFQRAVSEINAYTTSLLAGKPKDIKTSAFSATRRYVVDALKAYTSPYPNWSGFLLQVTKNIANVPMRHNKRIAGKSGYTLAKMARVWLSSLTSFSVIPLRMAVVTGSAAAFGGFIFGGYTIIQKLINPSITAGFTGTISSIFFMGGMILLTLGVMGEYLGRVFMTVNHLPQYVVREEVNCHLD